MFNLKVIIKNQNKYLNIIINYYYKNCVQNIHQPSVIGKLIIVAHEIVTFLGNVLKNY